MTAIDCHPQTSDSAAPQPGRALLLRRGRAMMCCTPPVLLLLASLLALPAGAAPEAYSVRLPREGLVVEVPYSAGTHHERIAKVEGTVLVDPETFGLAGGRLVLLLADFRSDNAARRCHLWEALGLDYTRSRFPGRHVCDDRDRLPESGPDSIAFPDIVLQLSRGGPPADVSPGADTEIGTEGTLTVHGVSRPLRLHLTAARDASSPGALRVRGRVPLRLADFSVQVKPAKVLFFSISVKDEVTVVIDALLVPVARGDATRQGTQRPPGDEGAPRRGGEPRSEDARGGDARSL